MTIEEFENGFWSKNPDGNLTETYNSILFHIDNFRDAKGESLTFEKIEKKYDEYLSYYITKFGQREEQYISKEDKKKSIHYFVTNTMYKNSFETSLFYPERDPYLFGKYSLKELNDKYFKFKQGIIDGRKKLQ